MPKATAAMLPMARRTDAQRQHELLEDLRNSRVVRAMQSVARPQRAQPVGGPHAHPPLATARPPSSNFIDAETEVLAPAGSEWGGPLSPHQTAAASTGWAAAAADLFARSPMAPTPVHPGDSSSTLPPKHIYIVQGPTGTTVAYSQNPPGNGATPSQVIQAGSGGQAGQHYIYIVPTGVNANGSASGPVAVVAPSTNPVTQTTDLPPPTSAVVVAATAKPAAAAADAAATPSTPTGADEPRAASPAAGGGNKPARGRRSEREAEPEKPKPVGIRTVEEAFGPPLRTTPIASPPVKRTQWGGGAGMPPPCGLHGYSGPASPGSPAARRRSASRSSTPLSAAPPLSPRIATEQYLPLPARTGRPSAGGAAMRSRSAGSAAPRPAASPAPVYFPLPRRSAMQRSSSAPIPSPPPDRSRRHSYTAGTQSSYQRAIATPVSPRSSNPPPLPARPQTVSPMRSRICFRQPKPVGKRRPWL